MNRSGHQFKVGDCVTVTTKGGSSHSGTIVKVKAYEIHLEASMLGIYVIDRDSIVSALYRGVKPE